MVAQASLPMLEEEAKKNMRAGGNASEVGRQEIDNPVDSLRDAAKLTGTNRQYVSDAKKLAAYRPDLR